MKPIIVAGGAGFIGSHLVDALLAAGKHVIVIDNFSTGSLKNLANAQRDHPELLVVHRLDISSPEVTSIILRANPDMIHMLAAQSSVKVSMARPLLDVHTNIFGLVNVLEAARKAGVRKVTFASSGGTIYGDPPEEAFPLPETTARTPESFYGLSKAVALDYLRIYKSVFGLDSVALALTNVYGPRQSPFGEAGVVSIFAKRLLNDEPCIIHGDGQHTRDYVYVGDVVRAFITASERGSTIYNIGSGEEMNVLDVYNKLTAIIASNAKPQYGADMPGEVQRVCLDTSKAQRELGWRAQMSFTDGAKTVVGWLQSAALRQRAKRTLSGSLERTQ